MQDIKSLSELENNPVRAIRVIGAFFPTLVDETIKDVMADRGITEDDIRDMIQKAKKSVRRH